MSVATAEPRGRVALVAGLTVLALVGFAANSLLCRAALRQGAVDPASFTAIRILSGAAALWVLALATGAADRPASARDRRSPVLLFLYALPFSYAYLDLGAGTGALILFGAVQMTMIAAGLRAGERLHVVQWAGLAAAVSGLVALVAPGLAAPSARGSVLMATAGVAWGLYSLGGRGAANPLVVTASNFAFATPWALAALVVMSGRLHASPRGIGLAMASGALASGVGYAFWYAALPHLAATRAAAVQLTVPVLAAAAGVALLGETVSPRLLLAAAAVLGGVALVIAQRRRR